MKVAKQGYSFFSVTAPSVFIEYELPTMLGQLGGGLVFTGYADGTLAAYDHP